MVMVKTVVKLENFDMEYSQYIVNPYGWVRKATLYDIIYIEDVIKYGDNVRRRKAREMMKMIDRVKKSSLEKTLEWYREERLAVC